VVISRRGATKLGCLFGVLLVITAVYFGIPVGEVYLRYYRFRDQMEQEARFAEHADDAAIKRRLASLADSLGLPEEATHVSVRRDRDGIQISSQWSERVQVPMYTREFHFAPTVEQKR
jgi:hypothetical protein